MGKAQAFLSQRGELPCLTKSVFLKASKAGSLFWAVLFLYLSTFHSYVKKAPFACVKAGRGDFF